MRQCRELFTTNYGVQYDNWVSIAPQNLEGGFYQSFSRGDYIINVSTSTFCLLVQILNSNDAVVYYDRIETVPEYKKVKKKLKWT